MNSKKKMKKITSWLLAVLMIANSLPLNVMADTLSTADSDDEPVTEEQVTEQSNEENNESTTGEFFKEETDTSESGESSKEDPSYSEEKMVENPTPDDSNPTAESSSETEESISEDTVDGSNIVEVTETEQISANSQIEENVEQYTVSIEEVLEITELPDLQTTANPISFLSDGVNLREGNYEKWIDRLANLPEYATNFYEWLEENSDNDGTDDALIEIDQATAIGDGYSYQVVSFSGNLEVIFPSANPTQNEIDQAVDKAFKAQVQDSIDAVQQCVLDAYSAFDRDHPEVFWLSGRGQTLTSKGFRRPVIQSDGSASVPYSATVYFVLSYDDFDIRAEEYQDANAIKSDIAERDSIVAEITASAQGTTLQKIKYLNNWLTTRNCYNSSSNLNNINRDARECLGALRGKTGTVGPVCEAYARAFKVLCDELGIPCVLVDGYAKTSTTSSGEAHMWNYVQMDDNNWYAVDVTWNDPTTGSTAAVSGYENEDWLLLGGETVVEGMAFLTSHPVSNTVTKNGIAFTNGPVLADDKYVEATTNIVASGTCGENLTWELTEDGVLTISGEGEMEDYVNRTYLPWYNHIDQITSVIVEEGVTSICSYAFSGYDYLTDATLPSSLSEIPYAAFMSSNSLTSITIPNGVTKISSYAFYSCDSLDCVILPDSVTHIATEVFYGCTSLKSIKLPDNLVSTDTGVFSNCSSLESITIPKSLTVISARVFEFCSSLSEITLHDNLTSIDNYAFEGCSSLETFTVPSCVTSLGWGIFKDCNSLKNIKLPDTLTEIPRECFFGCVGLGSITIPDSVESIGQEAFKGCTKLTGVTVPDGVTKLFYGSFDGCSRLQSITIPYSVTRIGNTTFQGCSSLKYVYYGGTQKDWTLVRIENNNEPLKNVFVCYSKARVVQTGTCGDNLIWTFDSDDVLTISGSGKMVEHGEFRPWDEYREQISSLVVEEGVTSISKESFAEYTNLGSITLSDSVTLIDDGAFVYCSGLESITIPGSVASIGKEAFYACENLYSVTIQEGVGSIGEFAFSECYHLESITIPGSVASIGKEAFYACENLYSVTIQEGAGSIGEAAFSECYHLESITIPESVTWIGNDAFGGCGSLTDVYYGGTEKEWTAVTIGGNNEALTYATIHFAEAEKESLDLYSTHADLTIPTDLVYNGDNQSLIRWTFYDGTEPINFKVNGVLANPVDNPLGKDAGTYTVTYWVPESDLYYAVPETTVTVTIAKAQQHSGENLDGYGFGWEWDDSVYEIDYNPEGIEIPGVSFSLIGDAEAPIPTISYREEGSDGEFTEGIPASVGRYELLASWEGDNNHAAASDVLIIDVKQTEPIYTYTENSDGTITITGVEGELVGDVTLPSEIDGKTVTAINGAFSYQNQLTSAVIPDTVTEINNVFWFCSALESVTIPASVKNVSSGDDPFRGCDALEEFVLSGENHAFTFENGMLCLNNEVLHCVKSVEGEVTVPQGTTMIHHGAFNNCKNMSVINIPATVSGGEWSLYLGAFEGCTALTTINYAGTEEQWNRLGVAETVPESVTVNCTGVVTYTYSENTDGTLTLTGYTGDLVGEVTAPTALDGKKVSIIGYLAFANQSKLVTLTIPEGVIRTYNYIASNSAALTTINLPSSLTALASETFANCTALTTINYAGTEAQWNRLSASANIPDGVTVNCTGVVTYTYSENTDGTLTLTGYTGDLVGEVTLPAEIDGKKVTILGSSAVRYFDKLTSLIIPEGYLSLNGNSIMDCAALESVTIPDSVNECGGFLFTKCPKLEEIKLSSDNEFFIFEDDVLCTETAVVACLASKTGSYTVPDGITRIVSGAFWGSGLTEVTLPSGLDTIYKSAFHSCSSLTTVHLPASLAEIKNYGFYGCTALSDVYYEGTENRWNTVTVGTNNDALDSATIHYGEPTYLYKELDNGTLTLTGYTGELVGEVTAPDTLDDKKVSIIGYKAFANQSKLVTLTIPEGVTRTYNYIVSNCAALTTINLPSSLTTLASETFANCTALTTINYAGTKHQWDTQVYNSDLAIPEGVTVNCNGEAQWTYTTMNGSPGVWISGYTDELVDDVVVPNVIDGQTVTGLTPNAFVNGEKMTSITLPATVQYMDGNPFYTCTSLNEIILEEGSSFIYEDGVLRNNYCILACIPGKTGEYVIPSGVEKIMGGAFYNCTTLTGVTIPISMRGIYVKAFEGCTLTISYQGTENTWNNIYVATNAIPETVTVNYTEPAYAYTVNADGTLTLTGYNDVMTGAFILPSTLSVELDGETEQRTVTQIAYKAFEGQTALSSVVIPDTVTKIGNCAFEDCTSLSNVTIPNSVTSIGAHAFRDCTALQSIEIPSSVRSMGGNPFMGCTSLADIKLTGENHKYTFEDGVLHNGYELYTCLTNKEGSYTIPSTIKSVAGCVFWGCDKLTKIIIPDGVELLYVSAFNGCSGLEEVEVPASIRMIGGYVFAGCDPEKLIIYYGSDESQWNRLHIPETAIPEGVEVRFTETVNGSHHGKHEDGSWWWTLYPNGEIIIDGIGQIPDFDDGQAPWHEHRDKIKKVTVSGGITRIGKNSFKGCKHLTDINIEPAVAAFTLRSTSVGIEIAENAFADCTSLNAIVLDTVSVIEANAFAGCTALKNAIVPEGAAAVDAFDESTQVSTALGSSLQIEKMVSGTGDVMINPAIAQIGDTVTIQASEGSTMESVYLNGTALKIENGTASFVVRSSMTSDEGSELIMNSYQVLAYASANGGDDEEPTTGVTVSGNVTSYNNDTDPITIELWSTDSHEASYSTTVVGKSAEYTISNVAAGTYTMKVSKVNHVTREYTVTVGDSAVTQDVKICLIGDANEDGNVNYGDIQRVYQHVSTSNKIVDYALLVADANNDGNVNYGDIQRVYQHVSTDNKLF